MRKKRSTWSSPTVATGAVETFSNVTMDSAKTNYVVAIVNDEDNGFGLVSLAVTDADGRPAPGEWHGRSPDFTGTALQAVARDTSDSIKVTSDVPAGATPTASQSLSSSQARRLPGSVPVSAGCSKTR